MERRDLIKDQIEQLGKVLAKILTDFLGFKSAGQMEKGIDLMQQELQAQLDLDLNLLLSLEKEDLISYLQERKIFEPHLEIFADYCIELSEKETESTHVQRAILFLDLADELSQTFSMERFLKKEGLVKRMKEMN